MVAIPRGPKSVLCLHLSGIPACLLLLLLPSALKGPGTISARGATNITVDDQDPRIVYNPRSSWYMVNGVDMDLGGTHMFTSDVGGYAEIKMTFISFYVISALYPCSLRTNIALDGTTIGSIDPRDDSSPFDITDNVAAIQGTVPHKVMFSYHGTSSQEHVVRLSSGGYLGSILDAFIFEMDPALSSGNSPASNNRTKFIAIGLGVAIPVLLLVILVLLLLLRKRRKSKKVIDFDPSAMGGRPATRQDIYPDDVSQSVANGDRRSNVITSPLAWNSLALETALETPKPGGDGLKHLQLASHAWTKTPEADSPLMAALLSERPETAGNFPVSSTPSTSPDSTTSLVNHHSRLPHLSTSGNVPLRPLSPVHHPSLRAQIQSRRRHSITNTGSEVGAYK